MVEFRIHRRRGPSQRSRRSSSLHLLGFVLIEIKSRPGTVRGDAHSWTWTTEGRQLITRTTPCRLRTVRPSVSPLSFADRRRLPARGAIPRGALGRAAHLPFRRPSAARSRPRYREAGRAPRFPGLAGRRRRNRRPPAWRRARPWTPRARPSQQQSARGCVRSSKPESGRQGGAAGSATTSSGQMLGPRVTTGRTSPPSTRLPASAGASESTPTRAPRSPEARDRLARTALREFRVLEGVEHAGHPTCPRLSRSRTRPSPHLRARPKRCPARPLSCARG